MLDVIESIVLSCGIRQMFVVYINIERKRKTSIFLAKFMYKDTLYFDKCQAVSTLKDVNVSCLFPGISYAV